MEFYKRVRHVNTHHHLHVYDIWLDDDSSWEDGFQRHVKIINSQFIHRHFSSLQKDFLVPFRTYFFILSSKEAQGNIVPRFSVVSQIESCFRGKRENILSSSVLKVKTLVSFKNLCFFIKTTPVDLGLELISFSWIKDVVLMFTHKKLLIFYPKIDPP